MQRAQKHHRWNSACVKHCSTSQKDSRWAHLFSSFPTSPKSFPMSPSAGERLTCGIWCFHGSSVACNFRGWFCTDFCFPTLISPLPPGIPIPPCGFSLTVSNPTGLTLGVSLGWAQLHAPRSWVILEMAVCMWKELRVISDFVEENHLPFTSSLISCIVPRAAAFSFLFPIPCWSHTGKSLTPCIHGLIIPLLHIPPSSCSQFVENREIPSILAVLGERSETERETQNKFLSGLLTTASLQAKNRRSRWLTIFCLQYHRSVALNHHHFPPPLFLFT